MKRLLLVLIMLVVLVPSNSQAQESVEITFVHIFGDENDVRGQVVQELVNDFMAEYPHITVNMRTTISDYDEVLTTTMLAVEQGDAPHVVQLDETSSRFAVDSGEFVSVESIATEEQIATFDDILEPVRQLFTVDGEMWSLPWNTSNPVLYYNRGLFAEAGLDPEAPPTTFDEMLATCETLMAADIGLSTCINWPLTSWFVENWVAMQGGLLADQDNGHSGRVTEAYFTSPEMMEVINWWKEMADRGYYSYTGRVADYNGEAGTFITQRSAMHINSTAGLSNFQHYAGVVGYDLGVAPLPRPSAEADAGTVNGGASLWITKGHSDAEIEAARDFVFFMTNGENIARWHRNTGYFPNRQSSIDILETEGFWEENPQYYIAVQQLQNTQPIPATAGAIIGPYTDVRDYMAAAVQSVIDQGESPEEALAAAKQLADTAIEDYNFFYLD